MNDHDRDLTPEELERHLGDLPPEMSAPPELEHRVVSALADRGLIRAGRSRFGRFGSGFRAGLALAAVLATFMVGVVAGRATVDDGFPRGQFMLLLYEGPEYEKTTDENFPTRFEAYNEWIAGLRATGNFVTGEQLDSTGLMVLPPAGADDPPRVEDRMSGGDDGTLGAMFLITADSYEEALAIARSAPHVRFGGRVAVRQITPI